MNCQSTTGMDQMDAFDQEDNPCAAVIYLVNEKKTEKRRSVPIKTVSVKIGEADHASM